MIKTKNLLLAAAACLAITQFSFAQAPNPLEEKFDFYSRGEYRPAVPRPQSILRYDVGDFHTTYAQMEKVMEVIAEPEELIWLARRTIRFQAWRDSHEPDLRPECRVERVRPLR